MKINRLKIFNSLCLILIVVLSLALVACNNKDDDENKKQEEVTRLLDNNGNFGGTLDKEKYGEGTPENGSLDIKDDIYYASNDYYHLSCTSTRTILPSFAPYQQTMADSDGIACALMALNYCDIDVNTNNEVELVNKYEALNKTTVYGNGTTSEGLVKLFNEYGISAEENSYVNRGTTTSRKLQKFSLWVESTLKEGKIILVRYQDGIKNRWHVLIGIDTMGTSQEGMQRDDVLIFADPFDAYDHNQDGYSVSSLSRFWKWWREVDEKGEEIKTLESVVITPNKKITLESSEEDPLVISKTIPDRHLLLNSDGSFGGSYNESLYGNIDEKNGYYKETSESYEHTNYNYYNYPDVYNMTSNDTLTVLSHYQAYEQTMASSCGICSTLSVLNYYGYDFTGIENYITDKSMGAVGSDNTLKQEALLKIYMQGDENCTQFVSYGGVGVGTLSNIALTLGFSPVYNRYYKDSFVSTSESMCFDTYVKFKAFVIERLKEDTPIIVCWCPLGGHFEVIIGFDDCGTESSYDDVIILADSHDVADHYQDGYNTLPAELFFAQWYNSSCTVNQAYLYFKNIN